MSDDDDGGKIDAVSENVVFGTNPKALLLRGSIHAVLTANDVLEHAKRHNITSEQTNGAVVVMAAAAQVWNGVCVWCDDVLEGDVHVSYFNQSSQLNRMSPSLGVHSFFGGSQNSSQ